jgi:hypothetical protein
MAVQVSLNKTFNNVLNVVTLGNGTSAGGTDTLVNTDTGKLHLIDSNHASTHTINLPAMEAGLNFKFIFIRKFDALAVFVINSADNTPGDFGGGIVEQVLHAVDGVVSYQLCGSHDILTINDDVNIGSHLEVYCDGSTWYWTGTLLVEAVGPNAVFST